MKQNDMPTDALDGAARKVLVIDPNMPIDLADELSATDNYEITAAATGFDAGLSARETIPHVIVIALTENLTSDHAGVIVRSVRAHDLLSDTVILAAADELTPDKQNELLSVGFDRCLATPYSAASLTDAIENMTDLVI